MVMPRPPSDEAAGIALTVPRSFGFSLLFGLLVNFHRAVRPARADWLGPADFAAPSDLRGAFS